MPPQNSAVVVPQRRSFETMSMWAFLATFVAAIFVFVPSSSVPFVTTKTFVLGGGALITLALYILARLSRGNVILPPLLLLGALCLPVIAYALSAVFSGVPFVSAMWGTALEPDTFGFIAIATFLGVLGALILRRPEQYRTFYHVGAWVFVVVALLEVAIVIIGQFAPSTISPSFSLMGSYEDLAFLLGLGLVGILITHRFFEFSKRASRALLASGIAALFLLAIANSSLVWILLALVSLGLFVEAVMHKGSKTADTDLDEVGSVHETPLDTQEGNRSLGLPLVVLAVSLFFLIGGTLGSALANSLHINVLNVRPSWQSTFDVAHKTYSTSAVFGTGPNTFGSEWLKYRDASLNATVFWNINFSSGIGFIPTSFVTTGFLGVLAWVLFLLAFVGIGLRMLILRAPQDASVRYIAILSFVLTLYLVVVAIFALPNTILLALMFACAGLFASTTRFATQGQQWGVVFARSPRTGFIIVFSLTILLLSSVAAAYTLVGRYVAIAELTRANAALVAGNLDIADSAVANSISFAQSPSAYQIQATIAATRLGQIAASTTMPPAQAQQAFQTALSSGINAALTATRLAPSDYQNWIALGNLYAQAVPLSVTGAYESARAAYEKAQALNPTNPQILYTLAQLNIAHKDNATAKDNLKAAIALKQDYTAAIFLLSQLEVQDGNVAEALAASLAAAYFAPNDPSILFQIGILRAAQGDLPGAVEALSAAVDANPTFANARYFLSAVYAKRGDMVNALAQMEAVASFSAENANAVTTQLTALKAGKNPFPANLLSVSSSPVTP